MPPISKNKVKAFNRGIYNAEYFSGAQVSLYIGGIWVDEITTLAYGVQQSRTPLYGYASQLFEDVSEGQILVTGNFTINFKEAGYLWLILNRYKQQFDGQLSLLDASSFHPFESSSSADRNNIEQIVNNEVDIFKRNRYLQDLASRNALSTKKTNRVDAATSSLLGFSSSTRSKGTLDPNNKSFGEAENIFETFENDVWRQPTSVLEAEHRRADDPRLNPFEIYITFGDFAGDDSSNHTIERLTQVYILGKSKQIQIDGLPIQEQYQFFARNLI